MKCEVYKIEVQEVNIETRVKGQKPILREVEDYSFGQMEKCYK